MKLKKLVLNTVDFNKKYDFLNISIFTTKYNKKIKNNEFHIPGPCKLIIETIENIYLWLFKDVIIKTDNKGDAIIYTTNSIKNIRGQVSYFTPKELEKAKRLYKAYIAKKKENLSAQEFIEFDWAQDIFLISRIFKIKIPYSIGGGF